MTNINMYTLFSMVVEAERVNVTQPPNESNCIIYFITVQTQMCGRIEYKYKYVICNPF